MLGHFAACPANAVGVGPIIVLFCVAAASCHARRPCALCLYPFPGVRSALYPAPSFPVPDPPLISPSLSFFLLLVTRPPHACLVERTRPPLLSFISPSAAHIGSAPCPTLSPQHEASVYPIHSISTSGVLLPTVATIKSPWFLLFFFIPIPLAFPAELRNLVIVVKLGSAV